MKNNVSMKGAGLTQAQFQAAVDAAIKANQFDMLGTREHDCSVTNIPASSSSAVEIATDASTAGTALATNIKQVQITTTFGEPIEILVGLNLGAATRKLVLNLGDGPCVLNAQIAAGNRLYVRTLTANAVTSGVLTINLMG